MDWFTFDSDEHGRFSATSERVSELVNFWNFRCELNRPLDLGQIQADVEKYLGYDAGHYGDVDNRFGFAIILASCDSDETYMQDSPHARANQAVR